jgi:hypothetical protein
LRKIYYSFNFVNFKNKKLLEFELAIFVFNRRESPGVLSDKILDSSNLVEYSEIIEIRYTVRV